MSPQETPSAVPPSASSSSSSAPPPRRQRRPIAAVAGAALAVAVACLVASFPQPSFAAEAVAHRHRRARLHSDPSAADVASGAADTSAVLTESIEAAETLRNSVHRIVNKSSEEVATIKSLLTTGAKATKGLNDLMLEMASLTSRMQKFSASMESCRTELRQLEVGESGLLTPQEADDPLLGGTALIQLNLHAHTLRSQVRELHSTLK